MELPVPYIGIYGTSAQAVNVTMIICVIFFVLDLMI